MTVLNYEGNVINSYLKITSLSIAMNFLRNLMKSTKYPVSWPRYQPKILVEGPHRQYVIGSLLGILCLAAKLQCFCAADSRQIIVNGILNAPKGLIMTLIGVKGPKLN